MIGEIRQNVTAASASVGLILATALIAARFSLCQALPSFHSVFAQLFSFRFPYCLGARNRLSTILLLVI